MAQTRWILAGLATFALSSVAPGCGFLPKKLSDSDCDEFAAHIMEVAHKELKDAADDCPDNIKNTLVKTLEKAEDDQVAEVAKVCKKNAKNGGRVISKDYDCFMKGKSFEAWRSCKFTGGDFKDADEKFEAATDKVKAMCKKAGGGAKNASDDDDAPKKKKKKASDDD